MDNATEVAGRVVTLLSGLIVASLRVVEVECRNPSYDADRSDDKIKAHKERAATLRRIREEFENEMTKPI